VRPIGCVLTRFRPRPLYDQQSAHRPLGQFHSFFTLHQLAPYCSRSSSFFEVEPGQLHHTRAKRQTSIPQHCRSSILPTIATPDPCILQLEVVEHRNVVPWISSCTTNGSFRVPQQPFPTKSPRESELTQRYPEYSLGFILLSPGSILRCLPNALECGEVAPVIHSECGLALEELGKGCARIANIYRRKTISVRTLKPRLSYCCAQISDRRVETHRLHLFGS